MNKRIFNQYIAESNFRELFIREMGWNNPKGQTTFDITTDDTVFEYRQIADRNGFQVLTCAVQQIPTSSLCKKIDTRLRRLANDYICIYHLPQTEHHLWVVPVKKVEKRDLVLVEYESAEKAGFLFEKMEGLCFDLDERTTIMDVKDKVGQTFIINSEKITKDFYTGFRKEHTKFAKFITGIDDEITDLTKNRNKQWYTSVMLNRLMFCYFIQKKGFLDRNINYLRDKLAWVKNEKGENRFYGTFYQGFLISLFHDGLNSPRHQQDFVQKYGRIPYLNGGMFSIHELEEQYPKLDIADEAFESLFAFFDQWHWHLDDRLTASGKDINPDVLGYIFEQYINDRAQMGAYYTKEDITEYIGRNTILPFLMDATKKMDERPFKTNGAVWQFLRESGDRYIFDAVKKGAGLEIPEEIAVGIDTSKPNLLERRSRWNEKTPESFALPTEIWRETIERLQRYDNIKAKIKNGEITEINDFITYNLDIRQFVQDLLAQTDDHLFVKHFYAQLRKVTILDPTCGSGAFLFAALNILEPLYEVCIERMQDWNNGNPNLFKDELTELEGKYRSNIRYFIYKNIILRNLYGVDIMVEATEIAKLRLFLKMVAVVDVNPRDPNLGLDPLPDIDFNIRCGNTLVGYATAADLEKDLVEGDMFANEEFRDKVHTEMDIVAHAYETFKKIQLEQHADLDTYRNAKKELKTRLKKLDDLLNRKLFASTVSGGRVKYYDWLKSHQPFHWLAEYYDIINGNGGFDVIIGNPPYVEYSKIRCLYEITNIQCLESGNIYAYIIEKSLNISHIGARNGMIIQMSAFCTPRMKSFQNIWFNYAKYSSLAFFDDRPGKLFDNLQHIRVVIPLLEKGESTNIVATTGYNKFYSECRKNVFTNLTYYSSEISRKDFSVIKMHSRIEECIVRKMWKNTRIVANYENNISNDNYVYYGYGYGYFGKILNYRSYFKGELIETSTGDKFYYIQRDYKRDIFVGILNSSLFYWFYVNYSDGHNFTKTVIGSMPYTYDEDHELLRLVSTLMKDLKKKSNLKVANYKSTGRVEYEEYHPSRSKLIIDEIDKVLAKHYGFTEEELDFIINYDIKYRMGDELDDNSGTEEEQMPPQTKPLQKKPEQKKSEPATEPKGTILTMIVRHETMERIISGEKTTIKRYLDDEEFAKEVLVTEKGKIKLSASHCPYTAKKITSIKLVCDKESIVKKVTDITFRSGINQQGKTAWKIIFHF